MPKITKEQALEALDNMDDYARMGNVNPSGSANTLRQFIEQSPAAQDARLGKLLGAVQAARYVTNSNGFDAGLPDKMEALRAALKELE